MAKIKPFLCIRPAAEKAAEIAALPYDVYNSQEARAEVLRKPLSFLRIDRAETQFEEPVSPYEDRVYQKAHDLLWQMVAEGDFVREEQEFYYVYELTMDGRVQDGLVACASIDDYLDGTIKKHENTREEKEQDRIRHVDALSAQTGPIFLAYRTQAAVRNVIARAKEGKSLYDFVSGDNIRHRVFVVDGPEEIEALTEAFGEMEQIYIADGHHRAASAVKVGLKRRGEHPGCTGKEEFNFFLSVLFADDQLRIMDYNRVVKDLNGYGAEEFLQKVCEIFNVEKLTDGKKEGGGKACARGEETLETVHPRRKGEFSMYLGDAWYRCRVKAADVSGDPVEGLDVSQLQRLLLGPVLGIEDPRTDGRIDFVGGIRGLAELERRVSEDCAVAFAMYPTSIQELFAVADAGRLMPPKSTWFEPKLRSGLFIHEI